jgi:hypothetical protein
MVIPPLNSEPTLKEAQLFNAFILDLDRTIVDLNYRIEMTTFACNVSSMV